MNNPDALRLLGQETLRWLQQDDVNGGDMVADLTEYAANLSLIG